MSDLLRIRRHLDFIKLKPKKIAAVTKNLYEVHVVNGRRDVIYFSFRGAARTLILTFRAEQLPKRFQKCLLNRFTVLESA